MAGYHFSPTLPYHPYLVPWEGKIRGVDTGRTADSRRLILVFLLLGLLYLLMVWSDFWGMAAVNGTKSISKIITRNYHFHPKGYWLEMIELLYWLLTNSWFQPVVLVFFYYEHGRIKKYPPDYL